MKADCKKFLEFHEALLRTSIKCFLQFIKILPELFSMILKSILQLGIDKFFVETILSFWHWFNVEGGTCTQLSNLILSFSEDIFVCVHLAQYYLDFCFFICLCFWSSEISRQENKNLAAAFNLLEEAKKEIDSDSKGGPISYADLIQFAG